MSDTFPDPEDGLPSRFNRAKERLRNFIFGRRSAYVRTFTHPAARPVLEDLAVFCRANESTFHPDSRVSAVLEGRREVWLRIQQHLRLSPDELFTLSTGGGIPESQPSQVED